MSEKLEKETVFYRKKAGELIKCVLAKRMPVKQALLAFPKDVEDESVRASWHALCHRLEHAAHLAVVQDDERPVPWNGLSIRGLRVQVASCR